MARCLPLPLLLIALPALAEQPGPAKGVPELQPLNHYVGTWSGRSTTKAGDQPPVENKDNAVAEWIHDGRFVRQTWSLEAAPGRPGLSGHTVFTYDARKKAYRSWNFFSGGDVTEAEGTWDAKDRAFTWIARNPDGLVTVTKAAFPEDGVEKWSITTTDRTGKVLFEMQGTNKREKK